MRVFLHICCGPCAIAPVTFLRGQGHQVSGFFYNPNIHPCAEYQRRTAAVTAMGERLDLDVIYPRYDPEEFLGRVGGLERARQHALCWRIRLEETAREAHVHGFEGFTTTLLSSPYQDIEEIGRLGEEIGRTEGVIFLFRNFRKGFAEGHRQSKEWQLYHQNYCGCAVSEQESAAARTKKRVDASRKAL